MVPVNLYCIVTCKLKSYVNDFNLHVTMYYLHNILLVFVPPNLMKFGIMRSAHRHNHVCQISSRSVQGLPSSDTPKIAISH